MIAGVCGQKTVLTIEELKAHLNLTDSQLDYQIQEKDFFKLSAHFDSVDDYLPYFGLTPSQQADINDLRFRKGTQSAMSEALRQWRKSSPFKATYKALVEVLLEVEKGEVAVAVCTYLSSKREFISKIGD